MSAGQRAARPLDDKSKAINLLALLSGSGSTPPSSPYVSVSPRERAAASLSCPVPLAEGDLLSAAATAISPWRLRSVRCWIRLYRDGPLGHAKEARWPIMEMARCARHLTHWIRKFVALSADASSCGPSR